MRHEESDAPMRLAHVLFVLLVTASVLWAFLSASAQTQTNDSLKPTLDN